MQQIGGQASALQETTVRKDRPVTVMLFASDPSDLARLRLGEEIAKVKACWQESALRDRIAVRDHLATKARDLRKQILAERPALVHFTGHGAGPEGLVLEDELGHSRIVATDALAELFRLFQGTVQCVLLNSCFSGSQASEIAKHIPCVIGMKREIGDGAAIDFAVGFYDALFAGESIGRAFDFGRNAIRLESLPDTVKEVLPTRDVAEKSPVITEDLPDHLRPVLLGNADVSLLPRRSPPDEPETRVAEAPLLRVAWPAKRTRNAVAAAVVVIVALGVIVWLATNHNPAPDPARVADAVRVSYAEIEKTTSKATGRQLNYRRLKAALFEAYPACRGQQALLIDAVRSLQQEGFFKAHENLDAADDLNLLSAGGLNQVLQQRLSWLESAVVPTLSKTHPADIALPSTLAVDFTDEHPVAFEHFENITDAQRQIAELRAMFTRTVVQ